MKGFALLPILASVAVVGGLASGGFVAYRWLQAHDKAISEAATLKCQAAYAQAAASAANAALTLSHEQRDADIERLSEALQSAKTRTTIREQIHHVKSPDCRRLPAEFGRLRNAGIPPVIRIPAQTPPSSGTVPKAAADPAAAAAR